MSTQAGLIHDDRARPGTVVTEVSQVDDNAAYKRLWRQRRPAAHERAKETQRIRTRALRILGQRHRAELRGIILELREAE